MPDHRDSCNLARQNRGARSTGLFPRLGLVLAIISLCLSPAVASAQLEETNSIPVQTGVMQTFLRDEEGARLVLSGYNARQFPSVELQLEAWDDQGNFLSGLKPQNLEVIENGHVIQPDRMEVVDVGLRLTLAVDISPAFGAQSQGASQYEHLRQLLLRWSRVQQGQHDDFSFSTPTGLYVIRSTEPSEWVQALQDYQPDLAKVQPSLNSLAEALNLATEPVKADQDNAASRQAILYITPPLPASLEAHLPALSERAADLGVRVFVWLLAPPSSALLSADHPLHHLADSTGGVFQQIYLPDSKLDIETLLDPLRKMYLVHYVSAVGQDGDHEVRVRAVEEDRVLLSNFQTFSVDLAPPNPIFLSPPVVVERSWKISAGGQPLALVPDEVNLKIVVDFPNSQVRALTSSHLYVDGVLVDENTSPPYDEFSWSLSGLEETAQHLLRVEVVDEFGMTGASTELPVDVRVPTPVQTKLPSQIEGGISTRDLIILISVIVSGIALALALLINKRGIGGRNSKAIFSARGSRVNGKAARRPVAKVVMRPSLAQPALSGPEQNISVEFNSYPGRLVSLDEHEQPVLGAAIPLANQEMTFGSDPKCATQILESPTVNGLHARMYKNGNGCFYLADENSVAGTWINYTPVTVHGVRLQHGDLIHFGRVMFRFELTDAAHENLPEVKVIGPNDSTIQETGDQT